MGTDDLFKKRKARNAADLARRRARRDPYAKVLIVCEGQKTEPHYFTELRTHYKLNSANVEVCGDCDSSPISVIEFAKERYQTERKVGDPFDKVFCVFDKDHHESYQRTLDVIRRATPKGTFVAVPSVPCFEYWLLLHFGYTARPYHGITGKSVCRQVTADLKTHLPNYAHGMKGLFGRLLPRLKAAKEYASRTLKQANEAGTDNPSTKVHELVNFLQHIKK